MTEAEARALLREAIWALAVVAIVLMVTAGLWLDAPSIWPVVILVALCGVMAARQEVGNLREALTALEGR
jgi:1,4-dihydroxy-2-naphthoate octaprenyltransferase